MEKVISHESTPLRARKSRLIRLDGNPLPFATCQKLRAKLHSPSGIHVQQLHRCPSHLGPADNRGSLVGEVILPSVISRMEEQHRLPCQGVDAGEIRALVEI